MAFEIRRRHCNFMKIIMLCTWKSFYLHCWYIFVHLKIPLFFAYSPPLATWVLFNRSSYLCLALIFSDKNKFLFVPIFTFRLETCLRILYFIFHYLWQFYLSCSSELFYTYDTSIYCNRKITTTPTIVLFR